MSHRPRLLVAAAAALLGLSLTACGTASGGSDSADAATGVTQTNAWGTAQIPADPQRVAVVSGGDRHIAYALGITPVIEWSYPGVDTPPYVETARQALGITDPTTFDAGDGTDFEAIAAAEPDVILGMNSYSMDDDYAQLAAIAPVITFEEPGDAQDLDWQTRLTRAGEGLGMGEQAEAVIAANKKAAADAAAAHPEIEGSTYTYLIVHPEQITWQSSADQSPSPLDDLGLVKSPNSEQFSITQSSISLENLDLADADAVLIAYPFGDEGVLTQSELETNKLWTSIPAVKDGRWGIIDSDSGLASDLAYPDALSYPWVIEQVTPVVVAALAGEGGS